MTIQEHSPLIWVVEPHDQLQSGRLATSRLTHKSCFVHVEVHGQILEHLSGSVLRVGEGDILEADSALHVWDFDAVGWVLDQRFAINHAEYTGSSLSSFRYFLKSWCELAQIKSSHYYAKEDNQNTSRCIGLLRYTFWAILISNDTL